MISKATFNSGGLDLLNTPVEEFPRLVAEALDGYRKVIAMVKEQGAWSWDRSIMPMEEAAEYLDRVWGILEQRNAVLNTPEVRKIQEELLPTVTNFGTELMQDRGLYEIYLAIAGSDEYKKLDAAQSRIIDNQLRDFRLSGVDLEVEQRLEFKQVTEELSNLENQFSNNVLDATEGWEYRVGASEAHILAGVPEHVLSRARREDGWVLGLDQPTYTAVVSYAHDRALRQEFYYAYTTRASEQGPTAGRWDNTLIIAQILRLRQRQAQLVGYKNYAEYSLVAKMADDVTQVEEFLRTLVHKVKPQAQRELMVLSEFARGKGASLPLAAWDIAYYAELYSQEYYGIATEELRLYFPEGRVLGGLFKLVDRVFGLQVRELEHVYNWDPRMRFFEVRDHAQHIRGYFFIDLYAREGKRSGAWMAECLSRIRFAAGEVQHPVAFLTCNFAVPVAGAEGLLTHDDVVTLFHEFGHTLHHILSKIDYYSVSGINGVEWDAVELPSQFMENWCWQWDVLQDISEHAVTGAKLPRDVYERLLASKNYNAGLFLLRQLEFGLFDLLVHKEDLLALQLSAHDVLLQVRAMVAVVMVPEFNRFENSFSHIFDGGYAAGYYSYLWAEVLSSDVFNVFAASGLYDEVTGERFLQQILERGGSRSAKDMFIAFAGREPDVDALLKHYAIV